MSTRRLKLIAAILTFFQAVWGEFVNVTTPGCYPDTLCEAECDPGYQRIRNRDPWCQAGGRWYNDMSIVCIRPEEFCPYPIPNGNLRGCARKYRDPEVLECDFMCNSGYYRNRSMYNTITCQTSLEWQSTDPESRTSRSRSLFTTHPDTWCIRKGGGVPICTVDPVFEIDHRCDTTSRGQCFITCPYNLDRMRIKCLDTGEWDKDLSNFCPVSSASCSRDDLDGHIDLEADCDTSAGSKCSFTCPSGTVFNVDRYGESYYGTVWCLNDGLWHYESSLEMRPDDACVGSDSVSFCPSTIENGSLEPGCLLQEGATCEYHCDEGYYAVSDESGRGTGVRLTKCDANGTWRRSSSGHYWSSFVATDQLCQVNTPCPGVPHGMLLHKDGTPLTLPAMVGEYYLFGCDNGYIRDRSVLSIDCTVGGKWKINHGGGRWDQAPKFSELCFEPTAGGLQAICPDSITNGHLVS